MAPMKWLRIPRVFVGGTVVQDATQSSPAGEVNGGRSDVRVDSDGAVVSIVLNRPAKLNALTHAMIGAVRDSMAKAQREPEVRVILLRGEGRAFCVGDDLDDLSSAAAEPEHQGALVDILQD